MGEPTLWVNLSYGWPKAMDGLSYRWPTLSKDHHIVYAMDGLRYQKDHHIAYAMDGLRYQKIII
jgi:hypothetical protein